MMTYVWPLLGICILLAVCYALQCWSARRRVLDRFFEEELGEADQSSAPLERTAGTYLTRWRWLSWQLGLTARWPFPC